MIQAIRNRQPGRPLWRVAAWYSLQLLCFFVAFPLWRYRSWGVNNVPKSGPTLYVANHESFLDAVALGIGSHRRHYFVIARHTLLGNAFLKFMGNILNAFPVEQGSGDVGAIRECIKVLKQDQALLIYPEGARTLDGKMHKFHAGTMLIIRKAKPTVLPLAVLGAYDIWPRKQKIPKLHGRLGVIYGEPIEAQTLIDMGSEAAMEHLRTLIADMRLEGRRRLGLPDEPVSSNPGVTEESLAKAALEKTK